MHMNNYIYLAQVKLLNHGILQKGGFLSNFFHV